MGGQVYYIVSPNKEVHEIQMVCIDALIYPKKDTELSICYYLFLYPSYLTVISFCDNWKFTVKRANVFQRARGLCVSMYLCVFIPMLVAEENHICFTTCLGLKCFQWNSANYSSIHLFICLFIHPFNKYSLNTYYRLSFRYQNFITSTSFLIDKTPYLCDYEAYILVEEEI